MPRAEPANEPNIVARIQRAHSAARQFGAADGHVVTLVAAAAWNDETAFLANIAEENGAAFFAHRCGSFINHVTLVSLRSRPQAPSPARNQGQRHEREHNPHQHDKSDHRDEWQRHADFHARVPTYKRCEGRYADQGNDGARCVPIAPWKHIQVSQEAAAMNASKGGSAAAAKRKRQIRNRGGGAVWHV